MQLSGWASSWWLYLHPLLALATVGLLGQAAVLGLRSRQVRRGASVLRGRHARLAPYAYALVVASWLLGAASVWWGRDDLDMAPFDAKGGLGKLYQLFGEGMDEIIDELNEVLAA